MADRSQAMTATVAGALVGAAVGYLFFTDRGRQTVRAFEAALDDFRRELTLFRSALQKASSAAAEGWQLLNDAAEMGQRRVYGPQHTSSRF